MEKVYTLAFREDTWILYHGGFGEDMSLELRIKFAYHGDGDDTAANWCRYQFIAYCDGTPYRVVPYREWRDQVEAIIDNEGRAAYDEWITTTNWRTPEVHDAPWGAALQAFRKMVTRWEAFLELGFMIPSVNHTESWPPA